MVQSQPTSGSRNFVVTPKPLQSLQEAAGSYEFPLFVPKTVPSGFQLQSIQLLAIAPKSSILQIRYATPDGHYLLTKQGVGPVGVEGILKQVPDAHKGTATVGSQPANWVDGNMMLTGPATDPRSLVWQSGPLTLSWRIGPAPGARAGVFLDYALQSDVLVLDQLVAIANSVRPYP